MCSHARFCRCERYDRAGVEQWLRTHTTSPLDPSCTLTIAGLRPIRDVRETIETLIESGDVDKETSAEWREKKKTLDLKQAQEMYDAGRVLDAAKLGLPKAQGVMAVRCHHGTYGQEKDLDKCFEWATKAAQGGDKLGQFRLAYAFRNGQGVEKNHVEALKWWELAADQGCSVAMFNIGIMYEDGQGVVQDLAAALSWYKKSALVQINE